MPLNKIIKEEIDSNIARVSSEVFLDKNSKESVVTGLALPFNKISRNEFTYDSDSIKEAHKTLEGASVLFNHDPNQVIGHVISTSIGPKGLEYKIDIDPEEKTILNKLRRGDLSKVSIQCIFDAEKSSLNEETGVTNAFINEFLEISVVSVPGFIDTTAQLAESFKKRKGEKMADKKEEPKEEPKDEPKDKEENKEEVKKEADTTDDEPDKFGERMAVIESRIEKIETFIKEQSEKKEADDEKPKDDEEDEKREEAIKKDKEVVQTEAVKQEKKITTKELKKALMEV